MDISPNSETRPPVRRRLIQSTLFPHKPQDNVVCVDEDLEPVVDQEDGDEDYCGSQRQPKKNRKRKPKAVSQSRASRKLGVNGNEIGEKNTDKEDSPVAVKVDFFVKVSERRNQQTQIKEQLSIHSPEKNEQSSPLEDILTKSKSPRKPRRRASSTPKKRQTSVTPEKRRMNSTPSTNGINGALCEDHTEKMLASPPKPVPNLRLEAKMTAEENSSIFAGKQIHPFFSTWKTGKKNTENTGLENKWFHVERKGTNYDFSPIHIFEKTQGEPLSVDWRNWAFSESISPSASRDPKDACFQLISKGSVNCLQFDNLFDLYQLCQNKGFSSQYPIQLEEISSGHCYMLQETSPVTSFTFLVDKQEPQCNQPKDIEVVNENRKTGENSESTESLSTQWQDTLLVERMSSDYHDCSYQPLNSLWTTKYQPERASEICGNHESVKFINEWLCLWHEKGSRTNKCSSTNKDNSIMQDFDLNYSPSESDSEGYDEETGLKNVLLVTGPVGSGKSAAIYACAKEQGFQVIEVNTSDWRNGALVKQKFGEAVESQWLQCSNPNLEAPNNKNKLKSSSTTCTVEAAQAFNDVIELISLSDKEDSKNDERTSVKSIGKENKLSYSQNGTKTLILFEDVDVTLCEDRGFIATIQQLAETAKRPMILTSNSDDPDLPNNLDRIEVSFSIPSSKELLSLAYMVCAAEKAEIAPCLVKRFIDHCQGDIRKTITLLQFWCQGQNQRKNSEVQNTYAPLLFDTNAGHRVLPQMISCGYPSKLSEMIEKEIAKSSLLAEKETFLMEIIEEEEENNNDSRMDVKESHDINSKKDEMLRRHCSDQDGNNFTAQCMISNEFPSCSSSPVAFAQKTLQKKYIALTSSDSRDCLNEELLDINEDVDEEVVAGKKRFRRKYNSVLSSDSEEEFSNEDLCEKNVEVNAVVNSLSHCSNGKLGSEVLLSEEAKLEETCNPSETPYYSMSNGMCKSGDVSCVPESSYVPETEIENGTMMYSSGHVDGGIEDAPMSTRSVPKTMSVEFDNLDHSCEEDKAPVTLVRDLGLDTAPVHGEEIGDSHIEPTETLPREYQMMDECSRINFCRKAETIVRPKPLDSRDNVQETWRKLRNCSNELRQYVSIEEKDNLEALELSYGMTDLISEADLLLSDCQSSMHDYLKPSMVSTEKSHSFSWHDYHLQMASTISQHGLCLYARRSFSRGSSARMDLAWEMLAASSNSTSLGKLINQNNRMVQESGNRTVQRGVSSKSMLESPLCNAVHSIVPLRAQLSLRGYVFHEYLSSLAQISRSESSRLSESINGSNKRRRKRVARNYLSNGGLSLSSEDISLLDEYSAYPFETKGRDYVVD